MKVPHYFLITCAIFLVEAPALQAQQVTVINHFAGDTTGRGIENFRITSSAEHRVIINYYEPVNDDGLHRLEQVIGAALSFYLDENTEVTHDKVRLKKKSKLMLEEMNEIVQSGVKFYQYREVAKFKGFTNEVLAKLNSLENPDFTSAALTEIAPGVNDENQLKFFFMQKQLAELKDLANREVGNYTEKNLIVMVETGEASVGEAVRQKLLAEMNQPFDPEAPLEFVTSDANENALQLLSIRDESYLPLPGGTSKQINEPEDDRFDRLLGMMEAHNGKLDSMQQQIDGLRNDQLKLYQQQQNETNSQLQNQISDLRGIVVEFIRSSQPDSFANNGSGIILPPVRNVLPLANLPEKVNIHFAKSSATLSAVSKLSLNEIVDIMARNASVKLLITGLADNTGSASLNIALSNQRATAVKNFFRQSGLDESRFVIQYFGARDSQSENADDRKVVLEFVQ